MKALFQCAVLITCFCISGATMAAPNLIYNGDFETGMLTDWAYHYTQNGVSVFSDAEGLHYGATVQPYQVLPSISSFAIVCGVGEYGYDPAHHEEGVYFEQAFTVPYLGLYEFHADVAASCVMSSGGNADGGTFNLVVDGVALDSWRVGAFWAGDVVRHSLSGAYALTEGTHVFDLLITRGWVGSGSTRQFADNISVTAIPEPSRLILLGCGLFGLAFLRRCERQAS